MERDETDEQDHPDMAREDTRYQLDKAWDKAKVGMFNFLEHSVFWRHPANDNPLVKVAQDFLDSLYWQEANRYSWPVCPPEYADDDSTSTWLDECKAHAQRAIDEVAIEWDDRGSAWGEFLTMLDRALSIMRSDGGGNARPYLAGALTPSRLAWFEHSLETFSEFTYRDTESNYAHHFDWKLGPLREAVKELRDALNIHAAILATKGAGGGLQFDGEAVKGLFDSKLTIAQIMAKARIAAKIAGAVKSARGRGRPPTPGGARGITLTEARRNAAIRIIDTMRADRVSVEKLEERYSIEREATLERIGAEPGAVAFFLSGNRKQLTRWAKTTGHTLPELKSLPAEEWERIKLTLQ